MIHAGLTINCSRDYAISLLKDYTRRLEGDPNYRPAIKLVCDCGAEYYIHTIEELPVKNVPCTCGDPNHFFVYYHPMH